MKKIKYFISLFFASVLLFFTACNPIEDDASLVNTISADEVILTATSSTPGGNEITLKMESPGVNGTWNYNTGVALSNEVTFVYPIFGKSTFTFTGTLGAEFFEKTIDFTVEKIDHAVPVEWSLLAGNTIDGKTWVFNGEAGDGGLWWYMVAPFNPAGWQGVWWNAGGTCCPPVDISGKMHFDLNGAANYSYYADLGASPQKAGFSLDVVNNSLTITNGGDILGSEEPRGNPDSKYTIISLTEDELILYTETNPGGTGWVWIFKPQ